MFIGKVLKTWKKYGDWPISFFFGIAFISLWFFRFGLHGWDNGIFLDDWEIYGTHYIFDEVPSITDIFLSLHRPMGFFLLLNLSRFWEHFQIIHLISSILHGINAIFVFLIARRLFLGLEGSYVCCLFFLLFPIPSEAVYWASCIHIVLGVTIGSISILLAFKYGAKGFIYKIVLTVMAFLSAALYEQTALLFGVSIGICLLQEKREKGFQLKRLLLCFLPLIGLVFYFILFRITTASFSQERFSLNPFYLVPYKYWEILLTYMRISFLGGVARQFIWNGFWSGMNFISSQYWILFLFIGNLCITTGVTWAWAAKKERTLSFRPLMAFLVGLGTILITLLIFSVIQESWFPFRVTYTPSIGLSLLFGLFAGGVYHFFKDRKLSVWFYPAVVLLLVIIFIPVNYSELTQYRRQRDMDIRQSKEIQSYFPDIGERSFFWLLNIPWTTQKINVIHAEHIVSIWAPVWGTKNILSCTYKKRVDGKPLHSGQKVLLRDFPPSCSNTYVFWFDKGSFYPVHEIVLSGTSGESRTYRFSSMKYLGDYQQTQIITLETADPLSRYPMDETDSGC